MTSSAEHSLDPGRSGRVSLDELARRRGVQPVVSVAEMADDALFEADGELDEFLAHVRAARLADLG